jgi:hypothetical protein
MTSDTRGMPGQNASPSAPSQNDLRYAMLLGRGRSGTTWIGQILNRYSRCVYKYEPFNVGKNDAYSRWMADLAAGESPAALRSRFDALSRQSIHDVDYPPFLRKTCRPQAPALLRLAWQIGKVHPPARGLYEWYGRPSYRAGDWVLVKQVNFPNEHLDRLVQALAPCLIGLVRNPYGSVASSLRFYETHQKEFRDDAAVNRVVELLPTVLRHGVPQYGRDELLAMSDAAFEAVRWRVQSEPLAAFTRAYERGMLLTHERFAAEPVECAREVFAFLGWDLDETAVERYVRTTTSGDKRRLGGSARQHLHSVHRDPKAATERWRKDLSEAQIEDIQRVVANSELLSLWP